MSTSDAIAESYGYITQTSADLKELFTKAKSIWQSIYLELFKNILSGCFPETNWDKVSVDNNTLDKILTPHILKANQYIFQMRKEHFNATPFKADLSQDIDFFDLDQDAVNTRITNPTPGDILPFISTCGTTAFEYVLNGVEGQFPYNAIPVMAIHPSIRGLFRFNRIFKKYITDSRVFDESQSDVSAIIEISSKSIIEDVQRLLTYFDFESKSLSPEGIGALKDIVQKYTAFTLPLLAVNMRVDRECSESLIREIYDLFQNHYTGSLYFQKRMFELITVLIQNGVGIPLAQINNLSKITTTLDFINPNYRYNLILHEILYHDCNINELTDYRSYLNLTAVPFEGVVTKISEEREALTKVIHRINNLLVLAFVVNRTIERGNDYPVLPRELSSLLSLCNDVIGKFDKFDTGSSSLTASAFKMLQKNLSNGNASRIYNLLKDANHEVSHDAIPGHKYANDMQVTTPAVYNNEFLNNTYKFLEKNSASYEHVRIASDIMEKGVSNPAFRELEVRMSECTTFEDAIGLKLDIQSYLDLQARSGIKFEDSEDAAQFNIALRGARTAIENEIKSYYV